MEDQDKTGSAPKTNTGLLKKFVPPRPSAAPVLPAIGSSSSHQEFGKVKQNIQPPGAVKFAIPQSIPKAPETTIGPSKTEDPDFNQAYTCFYTDQWRKKRPTFKDGFLRIKGKAAELFREDGTPSTKTHRFEEFINDDDTRCAYIGSFLVQIDQTLPFQDLDTGRCFLGNYRIPQPTPGPGVGPVKNLLVPQFDKFKARLPLKKLGLDSVTEDSALLVGEKTLPAPIHTPGGEYSSHSDSQSNSVLGKKFRNPAEPIHEQQEESKCFVLCSPETHPGEVSNKCFIDDFLMEFLMPHQIKGIQFMFECLTSVGPTKNLGGCILGDSMGLGKTLQVVALMWILLRQNPHKKEPFAKKVLVVCPVSLVHNWRNEVVNWLGEKRLYPLVADGTHQPQDILKKFSQDSYRCCIISYETLTSYNQYLNCPIDVLFCDEGHRLKNTDIKIYRILNGLRVNKKVLITGTPIQNNLMELFACVSFVNPHIFKNEKSFKRVYADPIARGLMKQAPSLIVQQSRERAQELMALVSSMMVRRTNKILEEFLPPRTEYIVYLNASQQQLTEYNKILEGCRKAGMSTGVSQDSMFSLLAQIRKVLLAPGEGGSLSPKNSCKIAFLGEILADTNSDSKVIIVSYYTGVLDLVEGYLQQNEIEWARLDGTLGQKERTRSIEKFASAGCNVFLLAAKAGGTGLNLVMANRMILLDVDWNPSNDAQVMGRIYRKGQTKPVQIYRLVVAGTVEEKIMERQISKVDLSNLVADSVEASARFTADELRDLFNVSKGLIGKFAKNKKNVKADLLKLKVCKRMEKLVQWVIVDKEEELNDLCNHEQESENASNAEDPAPNQLAIVPEDEDSEESDFSPDSPAILFEPFELPPEDAKKKQVVRISANRVEPSVDLEAQVENSKHQPNLQSGFEGRATADGDTEEQTGEILPEAKDSPRSKPQTARKYVNSRTSAEVEDILKEVEDMFT